MHFTPHLKKERKKKGTHQVGKLNLKCVSLFLCTEIAVVSHRVDALMPCLSPYLSCFEMRTVFSAWSYNATCSSGAPLIKYVRIDVIKSRASQNVL